ncbi:MAG: nucleoside triphosphate pyrophosphohydrolase [Candidatus Koribacter versatilis]|uniref:Nucleoside triphosphate pyrophosphohydrolase n=1 Tax=Candidatus Korobacter versatilis TaxID=658062 RepID=A0A932ENZ2_9BACT|nr:nucleoside triphosphate pyrophosphohydrolase [Candidatus Koribacter versatilis]
MISVSPDEIQTTGITGEKSVGLAQLPTAWVPTFFCITPDLHKRARNAPGSQLAILLDSLERQEIDQRLHSFGSRPENVALIVRSDSTVEGLQQRGMLKSFTCDGTVEGLLRAASSVFKSADESGHLAPVGLIIQRYHEPTLSGHLSNERRVAEETRRWVCEMAPARADRAGSLPTIQPIRVERVASASGQRLASGNRRQLFQQLKRVARYFYEQRLRRHLEWVWDGEVLWIVQNDVAPDEKGQTPEPFFTVGDNKPINSRRLSAFRPFGPRDAERWQKLRCAQVFKEADLPTTQLFVLKGASTVSRLAAGKSTRGLTDDLRELTGGSLVIRSDVEGTTTFLAPRTDAVTTVSAAFSFLTDASRKLLDQGVKPSRVCFIAHRFIPAEACAFSLAAPARARVRIDGMWGLPDGLEFCPHDSFEIDARNGAVLAKKVRHKPIFLAPLPSGEWKVSPLVAPWDWKQSLSPSALGEIARGTAVLASRARKPVVVMWFVGIPLTSGHPALVPWRFTTEEEPRQVDSAVGSHFRTEPFVVKNNEDLAELRKVNRPVSSVVLRPDGFHLRDERFLTELGTTVRQHGLRLDLEGSPLSHAYYVLKRTGAQVACVDPINPKALRQKFEKLVRDRIPVKISRHGERVETILLPGSELTDVLKAKLVEEALEVLSARSGQALDEEMADVLEVLRALARANQRTLKQVQAVARIKRKKVGGFGKGIFLIETEDTPLVAVAEPEMRLFEPEQASRKSARPIAAGRRPQVRGDRILIPLIPSAPSRMRGDTHFYHRQKNVGVGITYRDKMIEIVLEDPPSPSNPAQLLLPLGMPLERSEDRRSLPTRRYQLPKPWRRKKREP